MAVDRSERLALPREVLEAYRNFHTAYARHVADVYPENSDDRAVAVAIIADSFRRAAEAALVLGDDDALARLATAGRAYRLAGSPYGEFLLAAAGEGDAETVGAAVAFVANGGVEEGWWHAESGERDESEPSGERREPAHAPEAFAPDALAHPVQQVYLALAAAGGHGSPDHDAVSQVVSRAYDSAEMPVGAAGVALRRYAAVASELLEARRGSREATALLALLAHVDERHRESLEHASSESPSWTVELKDAVPIDLDAFGLTTFAIRLGLSLGPASDTFAGDVARGYVEPGPERPQRDLLR